MSVRARINGREFTLSWEEFEKALMRNNLSGGEFEILSIFTGVNPTRVFRPDARPAWIGAALVVAYFYFVVLGVHLCISETEFQGCYCR